MPDPAGKKPGLFSVAEEQGRRGGADPDTELDSDVDVYAECVKLYCFSDDGQWNYQGMGHVTIHHIEGSTEIALAVVDEKDDAILLLHKISSDYIYKKEETIISWKDPETALDLVLSFQEAEGCSYTWRRMLSIQKKQQSSVLRYDSLVSVNDELKDLPPLELSSLPLILETVLVWGMKDQMRVAKLISQDDDFFPKLVDLFRMCEDSRNMDGLHMIFRLVKGIILLNNFEMFHNMFSEDCILDIIGALEYDPELCDVQNHRAFLQKELVFKEAMPIRNASVVSKIHQTYRIGYIKDVILPKVLDVATATSLDSIIKGNNILIVRLLKDDASFIQDLFAKMKSSNISAELKTKLVLFLHEFCTRSKSLPDVQQLELFRDLISKGVLDVISDVLQSQDKVLVSAGTNILFHFLGQHPNLVRTFIANHEENYQEGNSLLGILVQGMVIDSSDEMVYQSCLMTLLDSSASKATANYEEVVIQVFVDKHIHTLIDAIASSCPPKGIAGSISGLVGIDRMVVQHPAKPEILLNICELLCFCVCHHYHRMKVIFFASNAMEKIVTLTCRREMALVVAAIRFVRTIIGRKDEFLNNRVINLNLLKPIVEAFVENGNRDNMLHSAVLELLDYMRKGDLEFLIEYVAESFWDQLMKFEPLESIQAFKLKYQQIKESAETKQSTSVVGMRKKSDERGDDNQEDYFKDRLKSDGLADCDDDGSVNNYNPPPRKPIKADEALVTPIRDLSTILMVGSSPDDGSHTCGKSKKPKLRFRISFSSSVASTNVTGRHSDLEDEEDVPLSLSTSTKSLNATGDLGDGSPGPPHQQNPPETSDPVHQKGEDDNDAAEVSSPKMVLDTTK